MLGFEFPGLESGFCLVAKFALPVERSSKNYMGQKFPHPAKALGSVEQRGLAMAMLNKVFKLQVPQALRMVGVPAHLNGRQ